MMKKTSKLVALILVLVMTAGMLLACVASQTQKQDEIEDEKTPSTAQNALAASSVYTRVNQKGEQDDKGEYLLMGSYPQSKVTDDKLLTALNTLATTLPTDKDAGEWVAYGDKSAPHTWYRDVEHEGVKYRALYFTAERPEITQKPDEASGYQSANGYDAGQVYWFAYEPVLWRILSVGKDGASAMVLADKILDAREFYPTELTHKETINDREETVYANSYEFSHLRKFLNADFVNTAFTGIELAVIPPKTVLNDKDQSDDTENSYACRNTEDRIFLLSYKEARKSSYGFKEAVSRQKTVTDYARCLGVYADEKGHGYWWLRSPDGFEGGEYIAGITPDGMYRNLYYDYTFVGVAPALRLDFSDKAE